MAAPKTQSVTSTVTLIINGQGAKVALKDVGAAANVLNREIRALAEADDPKRYKELLDQKRAISEEYQRQKERIGDVRSAWQKFKTEFGQIAMGVVGGNALTFALQKFIEFIPNAINHSMKLKDEFADIAKTTNMTDDEVQKLNKTLKTFNTRTTTSELRQLAAVGGQFGVAKNDIAGFVEAADKIGVAIGDQFGGTEKAAEQTLLLRNIFQDIKSQKIDDDLLHIGNALNVLEADGAATAPVMSDLASRMGGVLIPLKVSSAAIMGMSATLQELNVTAERGGTAVVDIFQRMLTETATFAKVANIPLKEYKDLIKKDINQAFIAYLKGISEVKDNQLDFAKVLEASKLTGSGASEVLMKLSANLGMLETKTKLAGDALQNTDSIMDEFQKRNHDLALGLKNLSEWWNSLLYSNTVQGFLEGGVSLLNTMLGLTSSVSKATEKFDEQKKTVENLTKNVTPLIDEYEKLKEKSSLSKTEQTRLKEVIQKIGEVIPSSVTELDKYGKALDINTSRAREAIKVQEALLKFYNKNAIEQNKAELERVQYDAKRTREKRLQGGEYVVNTFTGVKSRHNYTERELAQMDNDIAELAKKEEELNLLLYGLSGENKYLPNSGRPTLEERRKNRRAQSPSTPSSTSDENPNLKNSGEKDKNKKPVDTKNISFKDWYETVQGEIEAWKDLEETMKKERKDTLKELLTDLKIEYDTYYLDLEQKAANGLISEKELDEQKKIAQLSYLNLRGELNHLYGEKEVEAERELAQLRLEIRNDEIEQEKELQQKRDSDLKAATSFTTQVYREKELELDKLHAEKRISDEQYEMSKLELEAERLGVMLTLHQAFAVSTFDIENQITANLIAQNKKRTENDKMSVENRNRIISSLAETSANVMQLVVNNTEEMSAFQKAVALAQIAVDTGSAISSALQSSLRSTDAITAAVQFTGLLALITANMLKAKNIITSSATPSAPQLAKKALGGYTDMDTLRMDMSGNPQGYTQGPTLFNLGPRSYIAGEAGQEYVISNPMMQNPVVANIAAMLEMYRTGRSLPTSSNSPAPEMGAMITLLSEIKGMLGQRQGVVFNYSEFEKFRDYIEFIRKDAG